MQDENRKFISFSVDNIQNKLNNQKSISNDPTVKEIKNIVEESVLQYGEMVRNKEVFLAPKDFEKFAKLYLEIINQEKLESTDGDLNIKRMEQNTKEVEAIKDNPSFTEIKNQIASLLNKRNQES